jgi:TM2 domain-containing membrane protein YozV
MRTFQALVLITFITSISFSQTVEDRIILSGNLAADSKILFNNYLEPNTPQFSYPAEDKKSPILAGVLSLLIPGAGEIYTEEYLKAGIFLALEAAIVTTAVVYDGKGDDKTIEFQNYADDYMNPDHNWSVLKYAEWLITYEQGDPNMILSNDPNRPPWEQVDWDLLNAAETGSHKLPPHGEQQYYELIGKYHQYSSGWNDFTGGGDKNQISPNLIYYSGMRGEANDFYSVASTAVIGIYVNHFLSALDAVWSATQFNKDLAVKVRLENIQFADKVEFYPKVYFTYSF